MMKKITGKWQLAFLTTVALSFAATAVYAQTNSGSVVDIFSPQAIRDGTDVSVVLLGQLFGGVDGVLYGHGSQILGAMFGIFNAAVIGLGGLVVLYTIVVSTLNTAHEGEYLGRKWNSMWIPLRTAIGMALLIPKASGYSMIQIFIMWVVVQGVGAADTLWNATLQYIEHAGTIIPTKITSSNLSPIVTQVSNVLKDQICMQGMTHYYNEAYPNDAKIQLEPSFPKLYGSSYLSYLPGKDSIPNNNPHGIKPGDCGFVSFAQNTTDDNINQAQISAVWQVLSDMSSFAKQVIDLNKISSDPSDSDQNTEAVVTLQNGTLDYIAIMDPAIQQINDSVKNNIKGTFAKTSKQGWISAGSYYEQIASYNSARKNIASNVMITSVPDVSKYGSSHALPAGDWSTISARMSDVNSTIFHTALNGLINESANYNSASLATFPHQGGGSAARVIDFFTGGIIQIAENYWGDIFNANSGNIDPIVAVVHLGNLLITEVSWLWVTLGLIIFGIAFVTSLLPCLKSFYWAFNTYLMWVIPLAAMIMGLLFTAGSVMAYYVPLVPYMLFLFGALGWFLGVIESMVAAPLVALGITHPEGHETYGRAEPAIMLVVNIFLRPSLMIIGFICGILLSYIALKLLNLGFAPAVSHITLAGSSGWSDAFKTIAVIIIYTMLVTLIINKSFSLISEVPNKVLRWIGGADQLGDSSAPLEQVQGAVSSTAGKAGSTASELSAAQAKGFKDVGHKMGDKANKYLSGKMDQGADDGGGGQLDIEEQ